MKKVIVDNKLTYETDLPVKVGSRVILPSPWYMSDPTYEGVITALESDYNGPCRPILDIKE